jgi:hypothetical protein
MYRLELGTKRITSYAEAHTEWSSNKGFTKSHSRELSDIAGRAQGSEANAEHALDGKKRHLTLRLMGNYYLDDLYRECGLTQEQARPLKELRHYAFKYHSTDLIVWREDNSIIFRKYASASSNIFANRFTPDGVMSHFSLTTWSSSNVWGNNLVMCDDPYDGPLPFRYGHQYTSRYYWDDTPRRIYKIKGRMIILTPDKDNTYFPAYPELHTQPWDDISINKPLARSILQASNYHDFMRWALVYASMRVSERKLDYRTRWHKTPPQHGMLTELSDLQLLTALNDQSLWPTLIDHEYYHPTPPSDAWGGVARDLFHERAKADPLYLCQRHAEGLGKALRLALYNATPGVVEAIQQASLPSLDYAKAMTLRCGRWSP